MIRYDIFIRVKASGNRFLLFFRASEYSSENQSRQRSDNDQLQRKRHNEIPAVGCKIIRYKVAGEAISVV